MPCINSFFTLKTIKESCFSQFRIRKQKGRKRLIYKKIMFEGLTIYIYNFLQGYNYKIRSKEMKLIGTAHKIQIHLQKQQKTIGQAQSKQLKQKQNLCLSKKRINSTKKNKNSKTSHWNEFQQRRYIKFLQQSGHLLSLSLVQRRDLKVNQLMSRKVKTRIASQCHSHHQKMLFTYQNIETIIQKHSYLLQNEQQYFVSKKDKMTNQSTTQIKEETIKQQSRNIHQEMDEISQYFSFGSHGDNGLAQNLIKNVNQLIEMQEIDTSKVQYQFGTAYNSEKMMSYLDGYDEESPKLIYLFQEIQSPEWPYSL